MFSDGLPQRQDRVQDHLLRGPGRLLALDAPLDGG